MNRRKLLLPVLCLLVCLLFGRAAFADGEGPALGSTLPSFTLPVPASQEEMTYLGLKERAPFSISQLGAKLIILEVVNAL